MIKILNLILLLGLASCATKSLKTRPLKYSLASVKHAAAKTIPSKVSHTSPNGREIYFDYFPLPTNFAKRRGYTKDGKFLERAKAKVVVLGERRPYQVEVMIKVESLEMNGTYAFDRYDIRYSKFLVKNIEKRLVQRHEKSNLIDDFRAF